MLSDGPPFPGSTVTSSDPRYATLVRGFNRRWVGSPQSVRVVGDAARRQRCLAA
jgi:hypothetical protein